MKNYERCTNEYRLILFNEREKIHTHTHTLIYLNIYEYIQICLHYVI